MQLIFRVAGNKHNGWVDTAVKSLGIREQGSALTPVVAILTVFSIGAVLIAQSGLVNALVARFAQVVR